MVRILAVFLTGLLLMLTPEAASPASTKKKSGAAKKVSPAKPGAKKASPSAGAKVPKSGTRKSQAAAKRRGRKPIAAVRRGPAAPSAPSPDRYREIQQALIQRGYLQGEPTGVWGSDSVEALKRFQQDQNLQASGKLNALSLISLGLGPRRENPTQTVRPEVQQP